MRTLSGPCRLLPAFLLFLCPGCSDSTAPTTFPALEGLWDFTASSIDAASLNTCSDTGTFTFSKSDSTWVGTVQLVASCRSPSTSYSRNEFSNVRSGVATSTLFTFTRTSLQSASGLCQDTAVAYPGGQPNALRGTETCGTVHTSWQAVRGTPIASITVAPNPLLTVMGGSPAFVAVLRSSSGERVFSRPVAWSTDNAAVATVAAGLVTPVSVGSAGITASAQGLSATSRVTVLPPTSFGAVAAGDALTCALGADRRPYCWGLGPVARSSRFPIPVQDAPEFVTISGSQHHVCAQTAARTAWCWGTNDAGQLGNGSTTDAASPVAVSGSLQFAVSSAGGRHTCGLTPAAALYCWGANESGQLGNASTAESHVPAAVNGGLTFTTVSAGDKHTCGVTTGNALYCWGNNADGQLGDGTRSNRSVPTLVAGAFSWQSVAVGFNHTCGIVAGGSAWCWGRNDFGQFGNGTTRSASPVPVPVAGGLTFKALSSSLNYTCGVAPGGDAWCWGFHGTGTWGQLGNGAQAGSASPVKVSGGLTFASVTTGVYLYSD
ncbi:MAG TPA: hypothetical protein VHE78_02750, partial [Gemmatimonadaceae bacterium]|nr:hypothetical protein [Gemmatimonadaceae bacterium]